MLPSEISHFLSLTPTQINNSYYPSIPGIIDRNQERNEDHRMQREIFDLLAEDRFSKSSWSSYAKNTKKERLQEFFTEVRRIMNLSMIENKINYEKLQDKIGSITYGLYSSDIVDGKTCYRMTINDMLFDYGDNDISYETFVTIAHECRHAYQNEVAFEMGKKHVVSSQTKYIWKNNYDNANYKQPSDVFLAYIAQPIEYDAFMFERNYNPTRDVWPEYIGSWAEELYKILRFQL
ncbi:hypothetical protein AGMMS50284_6770 [Clostridia bacterium]|nr:hypothetical protein AGMMS50284_6770 [Clostridia bacterium]